jgi:hypothetical protein
MYALNYMINKRDIIYFEDYNIKIKLKEYKELTKHYR